VLEYARFVRDELDAACGELLQAVYVHGSAALGGWVPGTSDVDVLLVADDRTDQVSLEAMASVLVQTAGACPGRGLESSVVTVSQAAAPAPPWPFLLHVVTGPGEPGGSRVHYGAHSPGDTDLLMHYVACRAAGLAVHGPPPQELIGAVPRNAILAYLADELGWGLEHAPEAYAVLNACRAAIYLTDGQIVSKIAGGETALSRGGGPAGLISRALAQQQGRMPDQQPQPDAIEFVRATAADLRSAAAAGRP
jgi:hypothetical protein